jgi:hypothetical protein
LVNLQAFLDTHIEDTWFNLLELFKLDLAENQKLLNAIIGTDTIIGLKTIINRSLSAGTPAKFAWIKKIGHYIIDSIWIKVDDQ